MHPPPAGTACSATGPRSAAGESVRPEHRRTATIRSTARRTVAASRRSPASTYPGTASVTTGSGVMAQRPVMKQILPVEPAVVPQSQNVDYIYEPDPATVLSSLLPRFVEMEVYHAILEAIASEQSARMVAMKNATDSAKDLIEELTLIYHKARQDAITKELLDITGGAAAIA